MKILKYIKLDYFFVFVAILIFQIFFFPTKSEIRLIADDIGMLLAPAKLAGLNWSDASEISLYYGPGYYFFMAPLFASTLSARGIYISIILINCMVNSLAGVLLYHLITNILGYDNRVQTLIISILAIDIAWRENVFGLSNESAILLISILILILISKICASSGRRRVILYSFLVILIIYSIAIHSRNIVFSVALLFTAIYGCIIRKKGIKTIFISIALFCAVFFVYKYLPKYLTSVLIKNAYENNNFINTSIVFNKKANINDILVILFGNLYASIVRSYGLIVVSIGYYICMIFDMFRNLTKKGRRDEVALCEANFTANILFIYSGTCYFLGLIGISLAWAGEKRGCGYWRYYGTYTAFFIAYSLILLVTKKEMLRQIRAYVALLFLVIIKMFLSLSYPFIEQNPYLPIWFSYGGLYVNEKCSWEWAFVVSIICFAILLIDSKRALIGIVFCFLICRVMFYDHTFIMSLEQNRACNISLDVEKEANLSQKYQVGFSGSDEAYIVYQFTFKDIYLPRNINDLTEEDIVIFSDSDSLTFKSDNIKFLQLDDNEYVYTNSENAFHDISVVVNNKD